MNMLNFRDEHTSESLAFQPQARIDEEEGVFLPGVCKGIIKPLTKTKAYVTRGFKIVGATAKGLESRYYWCWPCSFYLPRAPLT